MVLATTIPCPQLFYATFTVALDSSSAGEEDPDGGGTTPTPPAALGLELSRVLLDSNVCFTLIGKVASFLACFLEKGGGGGMAVEGGR